MQFPPYLFGYRMTTELWYIVVFIGALVTLWVLTKFFKKLSDDFPGGIIIFALILIFFILILNIISGGSTIERVFQQLITNVFR
ncbi:MAG TPA: hypothetical protein VK856_03035 [Anaerolineaceae bacterium]|nr:hypothetical protein [Anaerolineaceae bacterium]